MGWYKASQYANRSPPLRPFCKRPIYIIAEKTVYFEGKGREDEWVESAAAAIDGKP